MPLPLPIRVRARPPIVIWDLPALPRQLEWFGLPAPGAGVELEVDEVEMETHLETTTLRSTQPGHPMQVGQI